MLCVYESLCSNGCKNCLQICTYLYIMNSIKRFYNLSKPKSPGVKMLRNSSSYPKCTTPRLTSLEFKTEPLINAKTSLRVKTSIASLFRSLGNRGHLEGVQVEDVDEIKGFSKACRKASGSAKELVKRLSGSEEPYFHNTLLSEPGIDSSHQRLLEKPFARLLNQFEPNVPRRRHKRKLLVSEDCSIKQPSTTESMDPDYIPKRFLEEAKASLVRNRRNVVEGN